MGVGPPPRRFLFLVLFRPHAEYAEYFGSVVSGGGYNLVRYLRIALRAAACVASRFKTPHTDTHNLHLYLHWNDHRLPIRAAGREEMRICALNLTAPHLSPKHSPQFQTCQVRRPIHFPFVRSGREICFQKRCVNIFTASAKNETLECLINSVMVYLTVAPQFTQSGFSALYTR